MSLRYILLGLLRDQPSSGYDLNKQLQEYTPHFWRSEQSQIYRALYKLQDQSWINATEIPQDGLPDKKIYHVTPTGQTRLETWLSQPMRERAATQAWMAQLYFSDLLSVEDINNIMQERIASLHDRLETYQKLLVLLQQRDVGASQSSKHGIRLLLIEHSVNIVRQEIRQAQQLQQDISNVIASDR